MKTVEREDISKRIYREILDKETHHNHVILEDEDGTLYWKENLQVTERVEKLGLDNVCKLFDSLGLNRNHEVTRKMFRDIGYSLFGYWEVFYCEANNEIADQYNPNSTAENNFPFRKSDT